MDHPFQWKRLKANDKPPVIGSLFGPTFNSRKLQRLHTKKERKAQQPQKNRNEKDSVTKWKNFQTELVVIVNTKHHKHIQTWRLCKNKIKIVFRGNKSIQVLTSKKIKIISCFFVGLPAMEMAKPILSARPQRPLSHPSASGFHGRAHYPIWPSVKKESPSAGQQVLVVFSLCPFWPMATCYHKLSMPWLTTTPPSETTPSLRLQPIRWM